MFADHLFETRTHSAKYHTLTMTRTTSLTSRNAMSLRYLSIIPLFLLSAASAFAQEAKNPLRFVPGDAGLVIKIERPRQLVEMVEKHELFQKGLKLAGIREYYDTTTVQQAYQLIGYFEKELGKSRDEIIDDLGAGGIVLAMKVSEPQWIVIVLQSKDEKSLRRFMDVGLDVVAKELERQGLKDGIVRSKYHGYDLGKIGGELTFGIADGALIVGNQEQAVNSAIDVQLKKKDTKNILQNPIFAEANKKAPAKALAWGWTNLEEARKSPQFKSGLDAIALDPLQMVTVGGVTDLVRRSPYVAAAVAREGNDFRLGISMPRGRDGMSPLKHMILPPEGAGTLPPLLPPRTLSSSSYYLDLNQLWEKRVEILGKKNADGLEDGDKNLAKFLGGIKLQKLFKAMGPHQRIVVAQQKEQPYKIKPAAPIPAFALVVDTRDPSFAKDMSSIFRTGALLATFQVGLRLQEETYKDCEMVSYFFSETKKVEGDPQNVRFNFSPTYVSVGNHFIMSATAELARDLIDELRAEKKQTPIKASMRTQLQASGLADLIRVNEDATLTQLILAQALPPKTAKEELRAIVQWIEMLGSLRLESTYGASDFRYDILWQPKTK
jgi:hypothetical protein